MPFGGRLLKPVHLSRLAVGFGAFRGEEAVVAVAIALGESGGWTCAYNQKAPDDSWGLWQINYYARIRQERIERYGPPQGQCDPIHNVRCAKDIKDRRGNFNDWGAYTNGSYKRHLPAAREGLQEMARSVKGLLQLLEELDTRWPGRSKLSDGWIGDPAHAARHSDHNPEEDGTVDARDFTHDPANGADMHLVRRLIHRDPRVKYIIFDGHIFNPAIDDELPGRPYSGSNQHKQHMHVSVHDHNQDDDSPWGVLEEDALAAVTREEFDALAAKVQDIWRAVGDLKTINGIKKFVGDTENVDLVKLAQDVAAIRAKLAA